MYIYSCFHHEEMNVAMSYRYGHYSTYFPSETSLIPFGGTVLKTLNSHKCRNIDVLCIINEQKFFINIIVFTAPQRFL